MPQKAALVRGTPGWFELTNRSFVPMDDACSNSCEGVLGCCHETVGRAIAQRPPGPATASTWLRTTSEERVQTSRPSCG